MLILAFLMSRVHEMGGGGVAALKSALKGHQIRIKLTLLYCGNRKSPLPLFTYPLSI